MSEQHHQKQTKSHQKFQVPKMEGFLNLIYGYFGGGGKFPLSRIHTAYIGVWDSSIHTVVKK